jgi:dienelactone hydrolase
MSDSAVHRPHPEAPALATFRPLPKSGPWADAPLRAQGFEFVSRGDFVPGVLYRPEAPGSERSESGLPLLLLIHDRGRSMGATELACAAPWVGEGLAVAAIDLPLHGLRASPKLTARLIAGLDTLAAGNALDPETHALVEEFSRQSTSDLVRCLDALCRLPEIDESRVGVLGFRAGGGLASYLLAHDPRVRAAVFVSTIGLDAAGDLDPARFIRRASGATLLMLEAGEVEPATGDAIRAFFDAAPEPKETVRVPELEGTGSGEANARIRDFFRKSLDL